MSKNDTLVSIIVPVHNTENYLEECLDSLINQTLNEIEIIVVNDGSTDNSLKILEDYSKKDNRIKLINKENEGQSVARNVGLKHATGEYIAFVDSDDYIDLDAYEKLYYFMKVADTDMVVCNAVRFDSKNEHRAKLHRKSIPNNRSILSTNVLEMPNLIWDTGIWNKLIKKSFWDKHNFEYAPGRLYEDLLLATELHCAAESVGILSDVFYHWRIREKGDKSTTQNTAEVKNLKDRIFIANELTKLYKSKEEYNELLPYHYKKYIEYDLPIFVNKVDMSNEEFKQEIISLLSSSLKEIPPESFKNLGIISKLKYQSILDKNIPVLEKLVIFSKNHKDNKRLTKYLNLFKYIVSNNMFFDVLKLYRKKKF